MTAPLLAAQAVSAERGRREVLRDVTFEVAPGEVVAVLGPNGAGKSTLLQLLGGQLEPSAGQINATARIATALQQPDLARRSARANVELALGWWGVPRRQRRDRADAALAAMRAEHLARRAAAELSGGERRRVHLARAVALQADVLLLDEPFAGLDNTARSALVEDTSSVLRDAAGAVVVVLHDRSEAWALADRLVVLIEGAVAAQGSPGELLAAPPTVAVARFLGYGGELRRGKEVLLTRPAHVSVDPDGDVAGTVARRVAQEDVVLLDVDTAHGKVQALAPYPGPAVGEAVRLRLTGGCTFPA